jgi:hypothetical protein
MKTPTWQPGKASQKHCSAPPGPSTWRAQHAENLVVTILLYETCCCVYNKSMTFAVGLAPLFSLCLDRQPRSLVHLPGL